MPPSLITVDETDQAYQINNDNLSFGWQLKRDFQGENTSAHTIPDSLGILYLPLLFSVNAFTDKD